MIPARREGEENHLEWMESCRNNGGSRKCQEGVHSNPGSIHALISIHILCFLREIKSKFCCWKLLFSNEMSAKNIKFTS